MSIHSVSRWIGAATVLIALLLATAMQAFAAPMAASTAVQCTSFEDLALGTVYHVGDTFASNGLNFAVRQFVWADGTPTATGFVEVENGGRAGGAGQELEVNNSNLEVVLAAAVDGLRFRFGEYGGNLNIAINGDFRNFANLADIDGLVIGGVNVSVLNGFGNDSGGVRAVGAINTFAVGGQEFYVDDLCIGQDNPEQDPQGSRPDLGDAPDSSNHVGIANTAYPAINGRFPTVWQDPTGAPSGPKHLNVTPEGILGNALSAEREADGGPDQDVQNNILAGGADNANNDHFDDGWRNRGVPLLDCRPTVLRVRVAKHAAATLNTMYLNVWFDGTHDGDWEDVGQCEQEAGQNLAPRSSEWIVQNFTVNMAGIAAGGFADINVNTVRVLNLTPDQAHWMRFTLSEAPVVRPAAGGPADGRGPQAPNAFAHGETEDMIQRPQAPGNPGQLVIRKSVQATDQPIRVGSLISYTLELTHEGGTAPATTVLSDVLPVDVRLAGPIQVLEAVPQAGPLLAKVEHQTVFWHGALAPGGAVKIIIPAKVERCPANQEHLIRNMASARQTDGTIISAEATFAVQCAAGNPSAEVIVNQSIHPQNGPKQDEQAKELSAAAISLSPGPEMLEILPGQPLAHKIGVRNNGIIAILIGLFKYQHRDGDANPLGVPEYFQIEVPAGETRQIEGEIVINEDVLADGVIMQEVAFCLLDDATPVCPNPVDGPADLLHFAPAIKLAVRFRDLGDAPDSSNHFTKTMEAYAGIKAIFPTVFDPATGLPQGPMHVFPRPFHLGQLVSQEVEADRGPDVDPTNNILPLRDQANLDRHDDGLRPNLLSFTDCATTTIPVEVFISPRAAAYLTEQQGLGYLNVWLDSNRDGDWEDAVQCPAPVGGLPGVALEHIAIDQPVNVTTLGPGLHVINVRTGLVAWDAKLSDKPAWLRVTLSERPANNTLTAGAINYGDGRGYDRPFALGETEDYKLHFGQPVDGADVTIRKEGAVRQDFEGEPGFVNGEVIWHINYHNLGSEIASSVRISDVLPAGVPVEDAALEVRSVPNLAYTRDGNTLVFTAGDVEPGRGGNIVVRVKFRMVVEQLPTLTNKVVISANNDGNAENNRAEATVQLGLRSPLITGPGNGTTCNTTVEIHGRAVPGSAVDLYIDGALIATLSADAADGRWTHTATLADGTHTLYAIARKNGLTSPASATVTVIVDSALAYDPLSLRLIDANGNVRRPVDETGRTDADGWGVRLRANMHYTLTVEICCTDPNANATIEVPGVGEVGLTYDAARDLYVGSFTTGDRAADPQPEPMSLTVVCGDNEITFGGKILIDPEGVVYDVNTRQPISAAQVSCLEAVATAGSSDSATTFSLWPAADYDQINPQSTLADGYFSFWTPAGTYRLAASHAGYQPYRSVDIAVVDELVHYDVWLTPNIADAATQVIEMSDEGFNPAIVTVQPGAVIEWVNLDVDGHTATSDDLALSAASGAAAIRWDSGLLTGGESYKLRLNSTGTFTYVDRTNPANTATIIVSQATGNPDAEQVLIYLPVVQR